MSTYALTYEVRFPSHEGRIAFRVLRISECTIESSRESLTDLATIQLPRRVKDYDRENISQYFRSGDPVEIYLGYDGNNKLEFEGYIKKVSVGIPIVIECENEMYALKRKSAKVSIKAATLRTLLEDIAPGYTVDCDDVQLGNLRYEKMAVSEILEDLKKQGINVWFDGKILKGFSYPITDDEPYRIQLENTAGESLDEKAIEATLVIMELVKSKGKKLRVEVGDDAAGVTIKRSLSGINYTESQLKAEAQKIYRESQTPGLEGDLILFGIPSVKHGDKIDLWSELYPEKDGVYYVDAVTKIVSSQGYRQTAKLGRKAV